MDFPDVTPLRADRPAARPVASDDDGLFDDSGARAGAASELGWPLTSDGAGVADVSLEWPVSDPPRRFAGSTEPDVGAERDVLLWQRWARLAGAGLITASALALRGGIVATASTTGHWAGVAVVGVGYAAITMAIGLFLRMSAPGVVPSRLPALVVAVDLAAAGGFVYWTAPARDYDRLLILGLAAVQVAIVYYGLSFAAWGLVSTLVAYVVGSLFVAPAVAGPSVDVHSVVLYAGTFLFAGGTLFYAFGTFRTRMNALRRFCRDVEVGELGGTFDAQAERRGDDLTLLARSVDEMRQRLIELVGTDPLTGCLNRRALENRLAWECRYARRRRTALAVLVVDIDHFKPINDSYGHPFGDYVLTHVADIMKDTARDTDAVARFGGDEFILVLPDTGWQGATAFAERLRINVDEHLFGDEVTSLQVTVSVGVAVAPAISEHAPSMLLAEADRSLYRAKSAGRNRISA